MIGKVFKKSFKDFRTTKFAILSGLFFLLGILKEIFLGSIEYGDLSSFISNSLTVTNLSISIPATISVLMIGILFLAPLPLTIAAIKSLQGEKIIKSLNIKTLNQAALLLILGLLTTALISIGTLFFIIPGIFLAVSFFLVPVYLSQDSGIDSLEKSWINSRGKRLSITGIMLISLFITSLPHIGLMLIGGEYTVILLNSIEIVLGLSIMVNTFEQIEGGEL